MSATSRVIAETFSIVTCIAHQQCTALRTATSSLNPELRGQRELAIALCQRPIGSSALLSYNDVSSGGAMGRHIPLAVFALSCFAGSLAGQRLELSNQVKPYVKVDAPKVVLTHVRVIDGTGAPAVEDQNVIIAGGKIAAIEKGADVAESAGVTVLNLHGYSVMPGIVGMHDHLFYIAKPNLRADWKSDPPLLAPQMA